MTKQKNSRQVGRPRRGRAVFTQTRIDALPEIGRSCEVARALGIKLASFQQWRSLKKNPLPTAYKKRGRPFFKKAQIVKWLIQTRRYTLKPEYMQVERRKRA